MNTKQEDFSHGHRNWGWGPEGPEGPWPFHFLENYAKVPLTNPKKPLPNP